jgi:hypothetical protein
VGIGWARGFRDLMGRSETLTDQIALPRGTGLYRGKALVSACVGSALVGPPLEGYPHSDLRGEGNAHCCSGSEEISECAFGYFELVQAGNGRGH